MSHPMIELDLEPLRDRALGLVQREGSWKPLTIRGGWVHYGDEPDVSAPQALLGLRCSKPPPSLVRLVTAERLARALLLDPVDLGF